MIIILLVLLLILLWISYEAQGREITSPAFIFNFSFVVATSIAVLYMRQWELSLHINTFMVIISGGVLFTITSLSVGYFSKKNRNNSVKITSKQLVAYNVAKWKMVIFIAAALISILWTVKFLRHNVSESTLARIIYTYRYANVFTENHISMPKILGYLRSFVTAEGYFFAFLFANNYIAEKKLNYSCLIVLALSAVNASLTGGRQNAINLVCAFIASFLLMRQKKKGRGRIISAKALVKYFVIVMIILWIFKNGGELIGRSNKTTSLFDYIAKYCGAEIKNLDIYLQNRRQSTSEIWGIQTFYSLWSWIGKSLPVRDLPFNTINGFNLGNVYTTYYDYIYDFGYFGIVPLIIVMAIVLQLLYEKVRWGSNRRSMMIWYIIFAYEFPNVLFSFFSNEFYIYNLSSNFVQYILFWIALTIFCFAFKKIVRSKKFKLKVDG